MDVTKICETIEEQKVFSQDVMNEIKSTKTLFDDVNEKLLQHIEDSGKVDAKLEETIKQVDLLDKKR